MMVGYTRMLSLPHHTWRSLALLALGCCLMACESVRTVDGEPVKESERNADINDESAMMAAAERRFGSGFKTKKGVNGLPEATSDRVSSFQGKIDTARSGGKTFGTKSYDGATGSSGWRDKGFSGGNKSFAGGKNFAHNGKGSPLSRDLRPDFMGDGRGLSRKGNDNFVARSAAETKARATGFDGDYARTGRSRYGKVGDSAYFEGRRNNTPPPEIKNYRDPEVRATIQDTRSMLGR